ncbi:hypothetical protein ACRARG_01875 [Pseudooceanicola sp. C21-150M6]|uniref:hypothetical protein n=1 Tax=Pseudooceanicola sp. C21-150M6 TaxID=3434355 RepID=UPI003D7F75F7
MFKKSMTAIGIAMIVATPALAKEGPFDVSDISAKVYEGDDAIKSTNAYEFYPEIMTDLENAIRAEVPMAEEGEADTLEIAVLVRGLTMDNDPMLVDGEFNQLTAELEITPEGGSPVLWSNVITINAETAPTPFPSVKPDDSVYYDAMLKAFAMKTADMMEENVKEIPETK